MSGWGEFERFICASTRNHARSRGFKEGCHQHTCPVDHVAALCACSQARSAARAVLTLHSSHASFFSPNRFHAMVSCHQCHPRHHTRTHTQPHTRTRRTGSASQVHTQLRVPCAHHNVAGTRHMAVHQQVPRGRRELSFPSVRGYLHVPHTRTQHMRPHTDIHVKSARGTEPSGSTGLLESTQWRTGAVA